MLRSNANIKVQRPWKYGPPSLVQFSLNVASNYIKAQMVLPLDSNALGASEWFICVALCQDGMLLCQGLTVQELQVDEVETGKTWKF